MPQADVLSLVNSLSVGLRDSTAATDYYERIVVEHGMTRTSLTDASYVAGVANQLTYAKPSDALRLLGVCYDDTWLYREDTRGVERYDTYWRTLSGEPRVMVKDEEDQDDFDLVPRPSRSGATVGVATPFTTFPHDNLTVVYTDNATDVQLWEELAVATEILGREFARDSDHQDTTAAEAWRQLSTMLLAVIDNAQDADQ